jgi:hypothetical protein
LRQHIGFCGRFGTWSATALKGSFGDVEIVVVVVVVVNTGNEKRRASKANGRAESMAGYQRSYISSRQEQVKVNTILNLNKWTRSGSGWTGRQQNHVQDPAN